MIDKLQEIQDELEAQKIPHEIIRHKPITTVEEGLRELGIEAADGVSTLIMKANDAYVSIIRRDDNKLDFKKIKNALGVSNLRFAEREKVKELTHCDIGYVSLLNRNLPVYMDDTVLEREYAYGGTGSAEHDLKIAPRDLVKLTGAKVIDISE